MNELEQIKTQLNDINNKRVKYQTLKEQALSKIEEINKKYNIKSIDELKVLVDKAHADYQKSIEEAKIYIEETNKIFSSYQGII